MHPTGHEAPARDVLDDAAEVFALLSAPGRLHLLWILSTDEVDVTTLVAAVRAALAERANPERAVHQQRYMKSALPYWGLANAEVRAALRERLRAVIIFPPSRRRGRFPATGCRIPYWHGGHKSPWSPRKR